MFYFLMVVGLPASGKSTFIQEQFSDHENYHYASTDALIEKYAASVGKTYNDVFSEYIDTATKIADQELKKAFNEECPIVILDQTNLTVKSRARKLKKVPDTYIKDALYCRVPDEFQDEWRKRLASREGKTIPENVLTNMVNTLAVPTEDEGFDGIFTMDTFRS